MSKSEEEEDEEETQSQVAEERFYESLDRILSSSNSSTSTSDDDDVVFPTSRRLYRRDHGKRTPTSTSSVPKFPMSAQNYDVWTSSDSFSRSSLEQRRDRLLLSLGLSSDTSLSRRKCNSSSASRSSIVSISSVSDTVNRNSNTKSDYNGSNRNGVVGSDLGSYNPPLESMNNGGWKIEEVQSECGEECLSGVEKIDRVSRIKNLDNGKEFVVNEVREDGVWNNLKEVGTGRQLTMEEFDICVGHSPIVQELMRRQSVQDKGNKIDGEEQLNGIRHGYGDNGSKSKKKVSWFKSIKNVASSIALYKEKRSSDERDTSSEKGGQRSSSATDDSQDGCFHGPERVRVRQYGKSVKELTALYKCQEIQAHNGSIWAIKFSLDGRYLASAGEDCVIHVWQVVESERKGELLADRPEDGCLNFLFLTNESPEAKALSLSLENPLEKKRKGRTSISTKSISLNHIMVPDAVFGLSEKPICSFQGHSKDVLDLSWSKSQVRHLLISLFFF